MATLLDYERLDVYHLARELARVGNGLLRRVPPGRADLADRFRRALLSIALNIAEGSGEFAPKEKARFYRMARRSATECGAILDHMVDITMLDDAHIAAAKTLIRRITGALVKLIQSTERPTRSTRPPSPSPAPEPASASNS
jgi:four helix bundle protein